jgi:ricin-type beta-trefoil lectin protein
MKTVSKIVTGCVTAAAAVASLLVGTAASNAATPQAGLPVEYRLPYYLNNAGSGLFMLARGWNTSHNGPLDLWDQHQPAPQGLREQWVFLPTGAGDSSVRIKNVGSGLCMQPDPSNYNTPRWVLQRQCDLGDVNQRWQLEGTAYGFMISWNQNRNRVLAPYDGNLKSHLIYLEQKSYASSQQWIPMEAP